jgi:hypothetical protein
VLYLVAGGLLVVFAANTAARVFAEMGAQPIHNFVGPAGFFVGLLGLFGLYPGLARRSSVLARLTAAVAVIPLVGWFVITVFGIGHTVGVLPDISAVLPGATVIVVFVATMLAYLLAGTTSLRSDAHSLTVGLLLLAPAIPYLMLILAVQVLLPVAWGEFVIDSIHALAHLALGAALWTEGATADTTASAADPTP